MLQWIIFCVSVLISLSIFMLRRRDGRKRVTVVVMGDIGRSPRMQFHALSFAKREFCVNIIGFSGSKPYDELQYNSNIRICHVKPYPASLSGLPKTLVYVLKALWQALTLLSALLLTPCPGHVMIQNPPGLPGLFVCWLACRIRGSQFIVDWHNYGYTILALGAGENHPFVKFSKWFEKAFGSLADASICVTEAMKRDLKEGWNIRAMTVYDRPPAIFKETPVIEQHKLFMQLKEKYPQFESQFGDKDSSTAFTSVSSSGDVIKSDSRPALLISSTSWTEDEDFSILLDALDGYEELKHSDQGQLLPRLVCVITGKGPLKEYYQSKMAERHWVYVSVCTPWLEAEDYPKLLGSADLGVCLHMSSSGLDLPMKVVDMFGCCLPVCAIHFKCLHELVKEGHNGMVFHDQQQLTGQLQTLLGGFPKESKQLEEFRGNLKAFQNVRWDDAWKQTVAPLFE